MKTWIVFAGIVAAGLFAAEGAQAHSITLTILTDNSTCNEACTANGGHDIGMAWDATGGTGATSAPLTINAVTAIDGGGDRTINLDLNFTIQLSVDVDEGTCNGVCDWTVDSSQSVLGLFGLRGDGGATAVGNQQDGSASISAIANSLTGNFSAAPTSFSADCANNCQTSQQFSGSKNDTGVLAGAGDFSTNFTVSFRLTAFTNDGCNGFICSSISGGEESGVLFGREDAMDQAVDNYGTWGRSITPDGYNATVTLLVPEPTFALMALAGLAGLVAIGRRRS